MAGSLLQLFKVSQLREETAIPFDVSGTPARMDLISQMAVPISSTGIERTPLVLLQDITFIKT
jgi:hypothetical protein